MAVELVRRSALVEQGRLKRKADVLPHHAKRLAIGPVQI
jgi:hypothetical protein